MDSKIARLTGTPLGIRLAIVLFIPEVSFIHISPHQQASEYIESTRNTFCMKDKINATTSHAGLIVTIMMVANLTTS